MKRETHTILLAEDDPNDQLLIQHAFRRSGIADQIHVVPNGREALAYLAGEGRYADRNQFEFPSFVLTDLKMPVMDGFGDASGKQLSTRGTGKLGARFPQETRHPFYKNKPG